MYFKSFYLLTMFSTFHISAICDPTAGFCALFSIPYNWFTNGNIPMAKKLFDAAAAGNIEEFKQLIDNGATFKYVDQATGKSVLHIIAEKNLTDYLTHIIEHKKLFSKKQNAPSLFVLERGYANAEIKDKEGRTPLHYAAEHGNVDIAQMLIDYQVNLHKPDKNGSIPLFYSLTSGRHALVNLLRDNTDPAIWRILCTEYKNKDGNRAIHVACYFENTINLIDDILDNDPNLLMVVNDFGHTPLHIAIKYNNFDLAKSLISKNAPLSIQDTDKNTPLHYAVINENTDLVKLIAQKNPAVLSFTNNNNQTALHIALEKDLIEMAKILISCDRSSLSIKDANGNTPLHLAVIQQNKELVALIIEKDPSSEKVTNKKNETPFGIAINQQWKGGKDYFLSKSNAKSPYLLDALSANKIDYKLIENLLKNNVPATVTDKDGNTPLAIVAKELDLRSVQLIMQYAPEAVNKQDHQKNLPLHLALQSLTDKKDITQQDKELIQALLIDQTMLVDADNKPLRNTTGSSVLDLAMKCSIDITNSILKQSTKNTFLINDPSPVDGFSPFLHACYFGKLDYVTLFASGDKAELEQQVSKSSSNYYGYTPLLLAAVRGYKDVYNYLKKAGCNEKACGNDGWNLAFILVAKKDKIDKDGKELEILLNEHPEFMLHKTSFNSNLLHFAVQYKNEKLFTYLSAQYPQFIHALNNDCDSPMHKAIASQNKNALEIMKRYGGIPNTILNADKSNYLFCALQTGDKAIVDICITPELINAIDQKTGLTPLAWSIKEKRNDLIAALLKKGADPKIVDQTGATALDLAVIGENKEGFDLIVPFYDEIEVRHILQIAVDKKDYFFTKLLAKMPQQKITHTLNSSFKDADCFLQYAIQKKLLSKIKIALTYGLNPNEPFSNGTLPLHFATLHGNKEIIEILTSKTYCSNPASVHAVDNHGRNALMLAALHGDADLVDYLLSRQINAQTKDSHGQTLLHFAAQSANVKVLNKVLKLGINIDTQDNDGNSPLLIATSYANTKGIQILVQHKANIELLNNKGDDVISLLKNHENKASFFDKNNFETVRFDIERQKLDLIKARADLKHLYSNVLALQQQNCQLLSQLQSNASGSHYIYQPAQLSTILQDLSVLSQDQIKDETKKLIAHKQQEEKEYQRLFLFWQQIQPYTQPSYQSAGSSSPEPSAPPMTAEEMAKYQAELNKTFSNNQQWSQAPQENNQSYPPYQNAYHAYGNHH